MILGILPELKEIGKKFQMVSLYYTLKQRLGVEKEGQVLQYNITGTII
jgi:hypothetical protein